MTIKEANGIIAVRMHDGDSFTECVKAVAKENCHRLKTCLFCKGIFPRQRK